MAQTSATPDLLDRLWRNMPSTDKSALCLASHAKGSVYESLALRHSVANHWRRGSIRSRMAVEKAAYEEVVKKAMSADRFSKLDDKTKRLVLNGYAAPPTIPHIPRLAAKGMTNNAPLPFMTQLVKTKKLVPNLAALSIPFGSLLEPHTKQKIARWLRDQADTLDQNPLLIPPKRKRLTP